MTPIQIITLIVGGSIGICAFIGWAIIRGGRLFDEVVANEMADDLGGGDQAHDVDHDFRADAS